jgi:hypothetical protein
MLVRIEIVLTKGGKEFESLLIKNNIAFAKLLIELTVNARSALA